MDLLTLYSKYMYDSLHQYVLWKHAFLIILFNIGIGIGVLIFMPDGLTHMTFLLTLLDSIT